MTIDEKLDFIINEMRDLKNDVQDLKKKQLQTQTTLETTIDKCIQVLGDGYQLNAERFDRLDIEAAKIKAERAFILADLSNKKVDNLTEKLNQPA